mgnify:FL=1
MAETFANMKYVKEIVIYCNCQLHSNIELLYDQYYRVKQIKTKEVPSSIYSSYSIEYTNGFIIIKDDINPSYIYPMKTNHEGYIISQEDLYCNGLNQSVSFEYHYDNQGFVYQSIKRFSPQGSCDRPQIYEWKWNNGYLSRIQTELYFNRELYDDNIYTFDYYTASHNSLNRYISINLNFNYIADLLQGWDIVGFKSHWSPLGFLGLLGKSNGILNLKTYDKYTDAHNRYEFIYIYTPDEVLSKIEITHTDGRHQVNKYQVELHYL